MLIKEAAERTYAIDRRLAALLSAVAGAINSAGFHATGFFSANQTGNASAMSDHLGYADVTLSISFAGVIVAFMLGAFASGCLITLGQKRNKKAIYAIVIGLEGLVLTLFGALYLLGLLLPFSLVAGLSFAMGLQNAATTAISGARVRTTHVSGVITDIGLGLSRVFLSDTSNDAFRTKLSLHAVTVFAFLGGGVGGALWYRSVGSHVFLCIGSVLQVTSIWYVLRTKGS